MDTFVTSFEEIGEARGRVSGQRDIVLRQLDRKIGPLSPDLRAQVAALAPDMVLDLSDALLDFTSVDELTNWLQQREAGARESETETFVTSFEEIGRAEGRAEGQRDLVLRLLDRKIGPLSADLCAQVAALAPEVLLELSDALLDFTSVDHLTDWLQQR
jgi:hypothetical protein